MVYHPLILVITTFFMTILALAPTGWACPPMEVGNIPVVRTPTSSILLLTWLEEPVTWETAAKLCRSKNPTKSMRLATFHPGRLEHIQSHIQRSNLTGSAGIWRARSRGDSQTLCPSISITSFGDGGSGWNFNANEECSNLLGGIMCEGSYTAGSDTGPPLKCFGFGLCSIFESS